MTSATSSLAKELEAMGRFQMGKVIGKRWKITQKLDEGGFGTVYKVQNVEKPTEFAALKVEPGNSEEGDHIKLETAVLKDIHGKGMRPHIPALYRSAKRKTYCYLIITLLGENLRRLKEKHFVDGFPLRTWSRVGIQCLYAIKTMHDRGYVHRDIKATNFVLGHHACATQARMIYIIDFGLARAYAFAPSIEGKKWIARRARANLEFRGTLRYASPSMHEQMEQGRKDDLWSFLYMMIDLYAGLPWADDDNDQAIVVKKMNLKDNELMIRMPEETKQIPKHLRSLDVYSRPNYLMIFQAFEKIRKRCNASFIDSYEWELPEYAKKYKATQMKSNLNKDYMNAESFFRSDPIRISGPPSAAEEEEFKGRMKKRRVKPEMEQIEVLNKQSLMLEAGKSKMVSEMFVPGTDKEKGGKTKEKDKTETKERKTTEDSSDFVPSCYLNLAVPKLYILQGRDSKTAQLEASKMDWGVMQSETNKTETACSKETVELIPLREGEVKSVSVKSKKAINPKKDANPKMPN